MVRSRYGGWPGAARFALVALAALTVGVGACGAPSAAVLGPQHQQDCTAVADVLSDGPDPTADPVGYAQAQVLPLRQLEIAGAGLRRAVLVLASAYAAYSASTPSTAKADRARVVAAEKALNMYCPGAAP